jgi:hypothetical protein
MESKLDTQLPFEMAEQPTPAELIKLIRKLRWIGLEDEARQLQAVLNRFPVEQRAVLPGIPVDCD